MTLRKAGMTRRGQTFSKGLTSAECSCFRIKVGPCFAGPPRLARLAESKRAGEAGAEVRTKQCTTLPEQALVSLSTPSVIIGLDPIIQNQNIMVPNNYFVYVLASKKNGTLYIGITDDLIKRVYEHKNNLVDSFTKKYNVHQLVYYETTNDIQSAIIREKQLKKWSRKWKLELIEKENPEWKDLYNDLIN